jgi:hypothetical protein
MKLSKSLRIAGLALILAVSSLPVFAARPCSCTYCPTVAPETVCNDGGTQTTCGYWLAVTLCPAG